MRKAFIAGVMLALVFSGANAMTEVEEGGAKHHGKGSKEHVEANKKQLRTHDAEIKKHLQTHYAEMQKHLGAAHAKLENVGKELANIKELIATESDPKVQVVLEKIHEYVTESNELNKEAFASEKEHLDQNHAKLEAGKHEVKGVHKDYHEAMKKFHEDMHTKLEQHYSKLNDIKKLISELPDGPKKNALNALYVCLDEKHKLHESSHAWKAEHHDKHHAKLEGKGSPKEVLKKHHAEMHQHSVKMLKQLTSLKTKLHEAKTEISKVKESDPKTHEILNKLHTCISNKHDVHHKLHVTLAKHYAKQCKKIGGKTHCEKCGKPHEGKKCVHEGKKHIKATKTHAKKTGHVEKHHVEHPVEA